MMKCGEGFCDLQKSFFFVFLGDFCVIRHVVLRPFWALLGPFWDNKLISLTCKDSGKNPGEWKSSNTTLKVPRCV